MGMLAVAEQLALAPPSATWDAALRRSLSSSYYATFEALATLVTDCVLGAPLSSANQRAWVGLYRSIGHTELRAACEAARHSALSSRLRTAVDVFVWLQGMREAADYDPMFKPLQGEALQAVALAEGVIKALGDIEGEERHWFAATVFARRRKTSSSPVAANQAWLAALDLSGAA